VAKFYHVNLTEDEREYLAQLVRKGKPSARKVSRARVLMLADAGKTDEEIRAVLQTSVSTICRIRTRFVEEGLDAALTERERSGAPRKLEGKQEAYLLALASSSPPAGRDRWTLQLLADRLVELSVVPAISDETVRLRLKKARSSLG
jgi:transposase